VFSDSDNVPLLTVGLSDIAQTRTRAPLSAVDNCPRAEIEVFDLVVETSDWASYREHLRNDRRFSGAVGVPGLGDFTPASTFGFGFIDKDSHDYVWVCGCLAK
jgi:hypothetical protein